MHQNEFSLSALISASHLAKSESNGGVWKLGVPLKSLFPFYTHTHEHIIIHTYMYTHTHIYIYILLLLLLLLPGKITWTKKTKKIFFLSMLIEG